MGFDSDSFVARIFPWMASLGLFLRQVGSPTTRESRKPIGLGGEDSEGELTEEACCAEASATSWRARSSLRFGIREVGSGENVGCLLLMEWAF